MDFFSIPLAAAQRSPDDIPPKKRAMYRRRQALLDDIFVHVEAALSVNRMDPHRQRLGQALAAQEEAAAPQPGPLRVRLAALARQFRTVPRPDQRLIAYLRKAGLIPTLRKAWRELLKQGPAVLWKPPDVKRNNLALGTPRVAARELFPERCCCWSKSNRWRSQSRGPGRSGNCSKGLVTGAGCSTGATTCIA